MRLSASPSQAQALMQTAFHHGPAAPAQEHGGAASQGMAQASAEGAAQPTSTWFAALLMPAPTQAGAAAREARQRAAAVLSLVAVRERGRIVDFIWQHASPAASRLLRVGSNQPNGKSLRQLGASTLSHLALIERYRRVIEEDNERSFSQVHLVKGRQDVVIHRVSCSGDTVTVTLTNLSADRRAQARRLGAAMPELPPY
jgi:hypothetical protein